MQTSFRSGPHSVGVGWQEIETPTGTGSISQEIDFPRFPATDWGDYRMLVCSRDRVLAASVVIGVVYVMFSEWLNVEVRSAWAYSDLMPVVPFIGTGLTPLLQWLLLPVAAYLLATRNIAAAASPFARHTVS